VGFTFDQAAPAITAQPADVPAVPVSTGTAVPVSTVPVQVPSGAVESAPIGGRMSTPLTVNGYTDANPSSEAIAAADANNPWHHFFWPNPGEQDQVSWWRFDDRNNPTIGYVPQQGHVVKISADLVATTPGAVYAPGATGIILSTGAIPQISGSPTPVQADQVPAGSPNSVTSDGRTVTTVDFPTAAANGTGTQNPPVISATPTSSPSGPGAPAPPVTAPNPVGASGNPTATPTATLLGTVERWYKQPFVELGVLAFAIWFALTFFWRD
jgi:hypothetical protein